MALAMLYKEWPDVVRVLREGHWWFIMRQVKYRGRMVDDVLEGSSRLERLANLLRQRGYVPMLGTDRWQKHVAETPHGPPSMGRKARPAPYRPKRRRERPDPVLI